MSISPQVFYQDGVFTLSGTASSAAGGGTVEISATVNAEREVLGTAKVDADGTFLFQDAIGPNTQGFFTATLTDAAGGTATSADPGFSLTGGLGPQGGAGRQTRYSANGTAIAAVTTFAPGGSERVTVKEGGQTFESDHFDTFNNGAVPDTTFVFNPGHGLDIVNGFRVGGTDHDTLSFRSTDFGQTPASQLAAVLANTHNVQGGVVIVDPTTKDEVFLSNLHKGQIAQNPDDIKFHT